MPTKFTPPYYAIPFDIHRFLRVVSSTDNFQPGSIKRAEHSLVEDANGSRAAWTPVHKRTERYLRQGKRNQQSYDQTVREEWGLITIIERYYDSVDAEALVRRVGEDNPYTELRELLWTQRSKLGRRASEEIKNLSPHLLDFLAFLCTDETEQDRAYTSTIIVYAVEQGCLERLIDLVENARVKKQLQQTLIGPYDE